MSSNNPLKEPVCNQWMWVYILHILKIDNQLTHLWLQPWPLLKNTTSYHIHSGLLRLLSLTWHFCLFFNGLLPVWLVNIYTNWWIEIDNVSLILRDWKHSLEHMAEPFLPSHSIVVALKIKHKARKGKKTQPNNNNNFQHDPETQVTLPVALGISCQRFEVMAK